MSGSRVSKLVLGAEELWVVSVPTPATHPALDRLTANELAVAQMAALGASNREIAAARGTAPRTVANQLASIYGKLDISGRAALAVLLGTSGSGGGPGSGESI